MNESKSIRPARFAASSVALAVVLSGSPAFADDDATRAFAATSEIDTASGTVVRRDVLVLQTGASGTSVRVVDGDVPSAPVEVSLASDGELLANSNDPSVTCYNMAVLLENAVRHPSATPATLFFAIADRAVPVAMAERLVRGSDGRETTLSAGQTSLTIPGDASAGSAAVSVSARIESVGGSIESAAFSEVTSVARDAETRAVGRTTCSIALIPVPVST